MALIKELSFVQRTGEGWSNADGEKKHYERYNKFKDKFYEELTRFIRHEVTEFTELKTESVRFEYCGQEDFKMNLYDWEPKVYLLIDWSAPFMVYTSAFEQEHKDELHLILADVCHDDGFISMDDFSNARLGYVVHWLSSTGDRKIFGCRAFVELFWEEEDA